MRSLAYVLLSAVVLVSVSACAERPGIAAADPAASQTSCSWLEGYPGCHAPGDASPATFQADASPAPQS